jgi:hypothetical protein
VKHPVSRIATTVMLSVVALLGAAAPAHAANPALHLSKVYVNSPGADTGTNSSLNAEYAVISNSSYTTVYTLTGYTLSDESGHVYTFPTFKLKARGAVTVHTGTGTNASTNLYWGSKAYIWTNTGDTAYLKNTVKTLKDSCNWGSVASYVTC